MELIRIDHMKQLPSRKFRGYQVSDNTNAKDLEHIAQSFRNSYGVDPVSGYVWREHFVYLMIGEEHDIL